MAAIKPKVEITFERKQMHGDAIPTTAPIFSTMPD